MLSFQWSRWIYNRRKLILSFHFVSTKNLVFVINVLDTLLIKINVNVLYYNISLGYLKINIFIHYSYLEIYLIFDRKLANGSSACFPNRNVKLRTVKTDRHQRLWRDDGGDVCITPQHYGNDNNCTLSVSRIVVIIRNWLGSCQASKFIVQSTTPILKTTGLKLNWC